MPAELTLDFIKRDASALLDITVKLDEVNSLIGKFYPGHRVVVIKDDASTHNELISTPAIKQPLKPAVPFTSRSAMDQLDVVLSENEEPMLIDSILEKIQECGGKMPRESLLTYLSRGRREGRFDRVGPSLWQKVPAHGVNGNTTTIPNT